MNTDQNSVRSYSWYALGLLTLVYVFNYLDRTIIYILLPLIKNEMAFTDLQLALLGSMSFVIFFTVLGIPFGRLADRAVRPGSARPPWSTPRRDGHCRPTKKPRANQGCWRSSSLLLRPSRGSD